MKILVIDDTPKQREHAIKALSAEHEVVVGDGFITGQKMIEKHVIKGAWIKWDMVLTDFAMPAVQDGIVNGVRIKYTGKLIDYGFPLAIFAVMLNVPKVAIVSTACGHEHPIFAAAYSLLYNYRNQNKHEIIADRLWAFLGDDCPCIEPPHGTKESYLIKNWESIVKKMT